MVLVEAGVEQPAMCGLQGRRFMVPRDPLRLSAACRSGRSTAGIGLASADAAAAGSEKAHRLRAAREPRSAEHHPRPAGAGNAERHVPGRGRVWKREVDSAWGGA